MRLREMCVAGLLILACSVLAFANASPTMDDQYILTLQGESVAFEIRTEDADIDPLIEDSHPLTFSILAGPLHGALVGDLTEVLYRSPHLGFADMSYVPADGFVGIDYIVFSATDPFGATALATVQIDVEERLFPGVLAGNWIAETTLNNTQTNGFTAFRTMFTEVYRIGPLSLKSVASFQMETDDGSKRMVFDSLRFDARYVIGSFSIDSSLAFDPDADDWDDVYDYWHTTTRLNLWGASLTHMSHLLNTQTDSYQLLNVSANLGGVSVGNSLRFDLNSDCSYTFAGNLTTLSWTWCDARVGAQVSFTDDGYEYMRVSASSIQIPRWGWLPDGIYVDTSVRFDLTAGKVVTTSFGWRPTQDNCVQVMAELDLDSPGAGPVSGSSIIKGVDIYGVKLQFDIPGLFGNVRVVSATSLTDAKNSTVTGQTDYFEVFRLSGSLNSCCGYPGSWSVATYFNEDETMLFDWGMTLISANIVLSDHFEFSLETVFRSGIFDDPKLELSVGWNTRW